MTIASVDAQLLSAHPPSQLEVAEPFFLAEEARFLVDKWVISHHINPIISHEYTINIYCSIHSYNGLYPLVN